MAVAEDDLRTQLESAFRAQAEEAAEAPEKLTEPPPDPQVEAKPEDSRPRDERGRFVSGSEKAPDKAVAPEQPAPEKAAAPEKPVETPAPEQKPVVHAPPNGWSAEAKAKWHELPPEIQAAVAKREQDIAKFTSKTDEERAFGRDMQRVISPYLPVIKAAGATPAEAVASLLNTAYILNTGTPQMKRQALLQVAQQHGIDLTGGQAPQGDVPQFVTQLQQEIASLRQQLNAREMQTLQQTQAEIQQELEAFAADPAHPHFDEVKAHMAALLTNGAAKDLQDAYDQACWARPDIRATLLAQQRAAEEQKRRSEEQARAQAARNKAVSITGGPGSTAAKSAPVERSLRDELIANFRASTGAV